MMINNKSESDSSSPPKNAGPLSFQRFLSVFENPEKIITKLDTEIEQLKSQINQQLKKHNINNDDLKRICSKLLKRKTQLIQYQNDLKAFFDCELNEIKQCHQVYKNNKKILDQITVLDNFFVSCNEIKSLLKSSRDLFSKSEYHESHKNIDKAYEIMEKINKEKENLFPNLSSESRSRKDADFVLTKLSSEIKFSKEELIYNLIQLYRNNVLFDDQKNETIESTKIFRFEFQKSMSHQQYESYVQCVLDERNNFIMHFENVFGIFNNHHIKQILENNKKVLVSNKEQIKIILVDCSEPNGQIKNLQDFIEIVLDIFTLNKTIKNGSELIKFIGELWSEQIFTCVINYCFERSLPKSESEFTKFYESLKRGNELESKMQSFGMIESHSSILEEYSKNIQDHFSTKLCQDLIVRMKRILKKPKGTFSSEEILEQMSQSLHRKSKFSVCQISDYMIQVKDLFEEMSALLSNSSSNLTFMLVETIYLVCELFIAITPYSFRELIESDSRENAIFHNNCLFFGYLIECLVLTHKPRLNSLFELVPCIRNMASQIFMNQMRYQERTLSGYIKNETFNRSLQDIANEIPSTDLRISSQSHFEFRECLNNCLKHLNHLHNSFVNTLPQKIYNKVFSTLLCILLNQFIESILTLNDISLLGSSYLFNEVDYFSKELKLFLVDSEEVIFKWMKLNEINFLFKSSLLEILNRWADGKGLLATYLKPDEVKHLIRALFQNNERRANILAKIN